MRLRLEWLPLRVKDTKDRTAQLNNCILVVTAAGEQRFVPLRSPVKVDAVRIQFDEVSNSSSIPVHNRPLASHQLLLGVPDEARAMANTLGYDVQPQGLADSFKITTSKKHMPQFTLRLDPKNIILEFKCSWLLLDRNGTLARPGKLLEEITKKLDATPTLLANAKEADKPKIIENQKDLEAKQTAIADALRLTSLRIPFSVILKFSSHEIVLAEGKVSDDGANAK